MGQNKRKKIVTGRKSRKIARFFYFEHGNKIFRKVIGIPMGSDPTTFLANIFLCYNDRKWIKKIKAAEIRRSKKFANCFRFIDDLRVLNDCGQFERIFREVHPLELELNKESVIKIDSSFLDLSIKIEARMKQLELQLHVMDLGLLLKDLLSRNQKHDGNALILKRSL